MKQTLIPVTIVALFLIVGCGHSDTATTEQDDSLKDVAHDAFIYAYPMMEQVKTISGMQEFLGVEANKPAMNPKLPWDSVG